MWTKARNEQGSFDLKQPGRTPEEELWKALAWMQRAGIGALIHAYREAGYAQQALRRGPIAIEYPERRDDLRLQREAFGRSEHIRGPLGDSAWTTAIELFRGAHDLYRPLINRARDAVCRVGPAMDDTSVPVAHRFTARTSRLIDRLDDAMPEWFRHPGQRPGDEYAERFNGFPDPSGLVDLFPELKEVMDMLRGVWGVERKPSKQPEEVDRVIALVRSAPAEFASALGELEAQYGTKQMRKWCRQTAMFERECSPCPRDRDLGWGRYEPRKLKPKAGKRNHPGYAVIPNYLMRARAHRNTSAVVPLRLAFLTYGDQPWDPKGDVRADREAYARKLAVLVALAFDADVGEYLAAHGAWACLPWWGEGSGKFAGGRSVLREFDAGSPTAWSGLCQSVLDTLSQPSSQETKAPARADSVDIAGEAPDAAPAGDLRPAKWFRDATGEAIYPDLLRRAQCDGRLKRSRKLASRWRHSISEVAGCYPEYAETLQRANESERGVTGANASATAGSER